MWIRLAQLVIAAGVGAGAVAAGTDHPTPAPLLSATDVGFAQDMSAHHQQAVTMADMLAGDAEPDVRGMAEEIRFQQLDEIGRLSGWLQIAQAPPAATHPMAWMHGAGAALPDMPMPAAMPGMASTQELGRLQRSAGRNNKILFLQLMIRHHQGGIDMAAYAVAHTGTDAVRRTASAMIDEQTQETAVMATMLARCGAAPLAYP